MNALRALLAPEILIKVITKKIGRDAPRPKRRRAIHSIEWVFIPVPVPFFDRHAAEHRKKISLAASSARQMGLEKIRYSLMQVRGQKAVGKDDTSKNRARRFPKPLGRIDVKRMHVFVKDQAG